MGWTFTPPNPPLPVFHRHGAVQQVDADGNNVAWKCPCGAPVLFVYQNGRRGSGPGRPAVCQCGQSYQLDPPYISPEPPGSIAPAAVMNIV
jgi:hypothetical protein